MTTQPRPAARSRARVSAAPLVAAALLLLAAIAPRPARAEEPLKWDVGVFGGGYFGSRIFYSDPLKILISSAPTWGIRVGYRFAPSFTVEGSFSHADAKLLARDTVTDEPVAPEADIAIDTHELDLLYGFGRGFAQGYFVVGGGLMRLNPDIPNAESDTKFEGTFGVGGKFNLSPRFQLRVDGRYRWRATNRSRTGTEVCLEEFGCHGYTTNLYSSGEITGGLSYRF